MEMKKATTGTSPDALLSRIAALEAIALPMLSIIFPSFARYVPAATALTGAAHEVVKAFEVDGLSHADAVASFAAVAAPPLPAPPAPSADEIAAARAILSRVPVEA